MNQFYNRALQKLGLRQSAYKAAFGVEDSPAHAALIDLAEYCCAFDGDMTGLSHDMVMTMHGRRQAFFRLFKHLNLSPTELETVTRSALVHAAARIATAGAQHD